MAGRLAEKVAVITGAGGGQGRAAALLFANEGAKVVVTDVKVPEGEETVQMINAAGGKAVFRATDVSQADQVEAAVRLAVATYGALHIMYNNAAVLHRKDAVVTNLEEDIWELVLNVNLKGVYLGCKYAVPEIVKAGGGSIINVSSLAGLIGIGNVHAYTASKGGVSMLMKTLAQELAPMRIRVNAISPGAIKTDINKSVWGTPEGMKGLLELIPYGRIGEVSDIAKAAVWLASDDSDYVTGATLYVDGGMTLYPSFRTGG